MLSAGSDLEYCVAEGYVGSEASDTEGEPDLGYGVLRAGTDIH